jgi:hypothetical protein
LKKFDQSSAVERQGFKEQHQRVTKLTETKMKLLAQELEYTRKAQVARLSQAADLSELRKQLEALIQTETMAAEQQYSKSLSASSEALSAFSNNIAERKTGLSFVLATLAKDMPFVRFGGFGRDWGIWEGLGDWGDLKLGVLALRLKYQFCANQSSRSKEQGSRVKWKRPLKLNPRLRRTL